MQIPVFRSFLSPIAIFLLQLPLLISVVAQNPPNRTDDKKTQRDAAERSLKDAETLLGQGTPESYRRSRQSYLLAYEGFKTLGDEFKQGTCLLFIGVAADRLGDYELALSDY